MLDEYMKKGFTLVELLAVIVILAVILVIAVPKITDVIESAKEASAARSTELYVSGIKNAMLKYQLEHDGASTSNINDLTITMDGDPVTVSSIVINDEGDVTSAKIEVNGYICNYSNTSNTLCINKNLIEPVHFYVDGSEYEFEEGMTWLEWKDSKYYNSDITFYETTNMYVNHIEIGYEGVVVLPSTEIIKDRNYETCFVAGTKVLTINGLVNIENIKVGDYVYSYNEKTNEKNYNKVIKTYKNLVIKDKTIITINGNEIISTSRHNYYALNRGWVEAYKLTTTDMLIDSNGNVIKIESIKTEKSNKEYYVYNLTIENNHTYFVGEDGILVHNAGSAC